MKSFYRFMHWFCNINPQDEEIVRNLSLLLGGLIIGIIAVLSVVAIKVNV